MKLIGSALFYLFCFSANAKFDADLRYSVSTESSKSCLDRAATNWDNPLVLGVDSRSGENWNLLIKASSARVRQGLFIAELSVVDVQAKQIYLKPMGIFKMKDGSLIYQFKVPYLQNKPKGNEVQRVNIVAMLHVDKNIYDYSTTISLVNSDYQVRTYREDQACVKSLPPAIIRDYVSAPPVVYAPQNIEFDYTFEQIFETNNSRLSGVLTLGLFRSTGAAGALASGEPSLEFSFYKMTDYEEIRKSSTHVAHTFKIRPNSIGYIASTHAEQWIPYKDGEFDRCGRLDLERATTKYETRLLPAFALVVIEPERQGNYDYIESKLDSYPKFNTCKGRL